MSKIQKAKQKEAKERGDVVRAKSLAYAKQRQEIIDAAFELAVELRKARRTMRGRGRLKMQPYDTREEPEHNDILRPEKRKSGHQPATAHPWRHQKPEESEPEPIHKSIGEDGEPQPRSSHDVGAWAPNWKGPAPNRRNPIYFAGFDGRFDQPVGPVVQHVKDGRPLTERGAELQAEFDAVAYAEWIAWSNGKPQDVVVSPSKNPPHSQQTKQVHQYQQKQGRR